MNTVTQNIPTKEVPSQKNKNEKKERTKNAARKTAQFVGIAGLGATATMGVNAMNIDGEDELENPSLDEEAIAEAIENEPTKENETTTTDFDSNEIMIEAEEVVIDDDKAETEEISWETNQEDIVELNPQPITEEDIVTFDDVEVGIAEVYHTDDPYFIDVEPAENNDSDVSDDLDTDEMLLADEDNIDSDFDLADDIV